jgi:hypothetical protein
LPSKTKELGQVTVQLESLQDLPANKNTETTDHRQLSGALPGMSWRAKAERVAAKRKAPFQKFEF